MNWQPKNHKDLYGEPRTSFKPRFRTSRSLPARASLAVAACVAVSFLVLLSTVARAEAQEARVPENSAGQRVVEKALEYRGVPYVLGGPEDCVPFVRMDCTCLTTTVFRSFGFELPDAPAALPYYGTPVYGPPRPGDVHVWAPSGAGTGGHAAIEAGNGNIIHANMVTMDTSVTAMYRSMYEDPNYLGAWRLVA